MKDRITYIDPLDQRIADQNEEIIKLKKLLKTVGNIIETSMTSGDLDRRLDRKITAIKKATK